MPRLNLLSKTSDHYACAPDQFPLGIEADQYNYEITITFNPQLYTIVSACDDLQKIETQVLEWLEEKDIQMVTFVVEYQKNRYPHFHIAVSSAEKLDITFRQKVLKGIVRIAGRSTFKPTIDIGAFEQYLMKDLKKNYDLTQIIHYKQYVI